MASLKEIKGRINSVKSTQKITSAMKMVASAKLRVAQNRIENFLPYQERLTGIMNNFLSSETDYTSPLSVDREVNAVAIIVLSSNSSLCGAFNSNIIKLLNQTLKNYSHLPKENIHVYPIGKKVEDAIKTEGQNIRGSFISLMEKPSFEGAKNIADALISDFSDKKIDKVELLYNHFKNTASQIAVREQFLPIKLNTQREETTKKVSFDYIIEPDKITVLESLIPKSLRIKLYAGILDSAAAEQAARTVAMQIATENASELLSDLTIQYNKQRQQAITNELLDIVGGSEALK